MEACGPNTWTISNGHYNLLADYYLLTEWRDADLLLLTLTFYSGGESKKKKFYILLPLVNKRPQQVYVTIFTYYCY
jgi:hypothetical protein